MSQYAETKSNSIQIEIKHGQKPDAAHKCKKQSLFLWIQPKLKAQTFNFSVILTFFKRNVFYFALKIFQFWKKFYLVSVTIVIISDDDNFIVSSSIPFFIMLVRFVTVTGFSLDIERITNIFKEITKFFAYKSWFTTATMFLTKFSTSGLSPTNFLPIYFVFSFLRSFWKRKNLFFFHKSFQN